MTESEKRFVLAAATGEVAMIVAASSAHKAAADRLVRAAEQLAGERLGATSNLMMAFFSGAKKFLLLATPAELLKIAAFIRDPDTRARIEGLATTPLGKDAFALERVSVNQFEVLLALGMTPRQVQYACSHVVDGMAVDEFEDLGLPAGGRQVVRARLPVRGVALSESSMGALGAEDIAALGATHVIAPDGRLLAEARKLGMKSYLRVSGGDDLARASDADGPAVVRSDDVDPAAFAEAAVAFGQENPGGEILLPADAAFDQAASRAEDEGLMTCRRLGAGGWTLLDAAGRGGLTGSLLRFVDQPFVALVEEPLSAIDAAALRVIPWCEGEDVASRLFTAIVHRTDVPGADAFAQVLRGIESGDEEDVADGAAALRGAVEKLGDETPKGLLEIAGWTP